MVLQRRGNNEGCTDLDEKLPCRQQALGGNQGGQSQVQAPVAPQEKMLKLEEVFWNSS